MMSCLIDNNNNKCNSLVLNVREGAKNTLRGCGFVRPSVTHLPYFFGLPSPPHFLKKVLTPPPPLQKFWATPLFEKVIPLKNIKKKRKKQGIFARSAHIFLEKVLTSPHFECLFTFYVT